ncbi:DedA family protein [Spirosoma utsteinense]|uniref:Membrane-associated protein n=1 Tax=Spirosoma utsteinense TaxID=2585773 RepID=A0ABR6WDV3_9BACT|nr:DedA family protein [Spirosoma utsteinense]MBC3784464.1 membrane-associated protein [Spirosoma utsteinense]MBC3794709.1 membrane-associated protein [Spirosoma utsteinense]
MNELIDFFRYLLNSEEIIRTGGLVLITLIIFVENGIFFGFFLPGDYLLFLAGVFAGTKVLNVPLWLLLSCIFGAAVLGSLLGYLTGYYFGGRIQNRKDSLFFKQKYIENTRVAFEKYGTSALIVARFLPIVRTFAPILAGLIHMNFRFFMLYNVIGGAVWVLVLVGGGFYFGEHFPWIINYVHWIVIFFLAVTTFTVVRGYLSARKENRAEKVS